MKIEGLKGRKRYEKDCVNFFKRKYQKLVTYL